MSNNFYSDNINWFYLCNASLSYGR